MSIAYIITICSLQAIVLPVYTHTLTVATLISSRETTRLSWLT